MNNPIRKFFGVFYDVDFYKNLVTQGRGIGFAFLVLVSVINTSQVVYILHEPYKLFMEEREDVFNALPALSIKEDTITADNDQPVLISFLKKFDGGPVSVLIDTRDTQTDRNNIKKKMADDHLIFYLNSHALYIFDKSRDKLDSYTASYLQAGKGEVTVSREKWQEISQFVKDHFSLTTILFLWTTSLFGHFFTAFAGAILLLVLSPLFKVDLLLAPAMRLSSAAKIPVAVLFLIVTPGLVGQLLVWFGFAMFGLFASRTPSNPDTSSNKLA